MMKKKNTAEKLLSEADRNIDFHKEELSFLEYQENLTRSRKAKKTRIALIALSSAVYLLGLGLFALIVKTILEISKKAGIIVGLILLVLYTVLFVILIVSIFSKHSFDLEFKKRNNGHYSEWTNNRVRWEIARNIKDQTAVLDYIGRTKDKEHLSSKENLNLAAFYNMMKVLENHPHHAPSSHHPDSKVLAESLNISLKKSGVIYQKAKKMILKSAIETGTLTAISQNSLLDTGIVAIKDLTLVKNIIWLYGFRPTDGEMAKILSRIVLSVTVSLGLSSLPSHAKALSKAMGKSSDNILVGMLSSLINMSAELVGNGILTYLIGKHTIDTMLREYRIQDLFRVKTLQAYEMEISEVSVSEVEEGIENEKKALSPEETKMLKKPEEAPEKKSFFQRLFSRKEKK